MSKLISFFPPHINDLDLAFGTTKYLPKFSDLPKEYQKQMAPGCKLAEAIFYEGWEAAGKKAQELMGDAMNFLMAEPPKDHAYAEGEERDPLVRFHRCITAHLRSWEPKHEHKIAGVGYMMDQWCVAVEKED